MTFHTEAVAAECRRALELLRGQDWLQSFYLAGGTALALQLGHRISIDLDWFSAQPVLMAGEHGATLDALRRLGPFEMRHEEEGQLYGQLAGADVSFVRMHHKLLEPTVDFNGAQLASPFDIGVMKLAAINQRGTRRDFVDLYCLRSIASIQQLTAAAEVNYADRPSFLDITSRALAYFDEAEQQPMPRVLWSDVDWPDVKRYCQAGAKWLVAHQRARYA